MSTRREFITLFGGAAATWPMAAGAQQTAMPLIGMLLSGSRASSDPTLRGFHQGLAESGYVEAGNVIIEYRWAEDRNERFPQLAAELVQRGVSVLVAIGSPAVAAAKAATTIIPIVFYVGVDPVSFGLVDSLGRPGGNLTGVTNFSLETGPKRLELLADLLGSRKLVGILLNPRRARTETELRDLLQAAHTLGLQPHVLYAGSDEEFEAVFATLTQLGAGGLAISGDPFFNSRWASRSAVPKTRAADDVPSSRVHRSGRPYQLRKQLRGVVAANGRVCRSGSEGREASQLAGAAAHQA
jgi:putative tryptophan/tyrosine transport system substrate-binding protein